MKNEIFELLQQRADISARLILLPHRGNPEIKEANSKKYLYMRKRVAGKLLSEYVGDYNRKNVQSDGKSAKSKH